MWIGLTFIDEHLLSLYIVKMQSRNLMQIATGASGTDLGPHAPLPLHPECQSSTVKLATEGTAGRDAWFGIRRGRKDAKGQQSLESAATLTLGSMFLARFSTNLTRTIDLANAFKSFFRDDYFKQCSKIAGCLGKHAWGSWGARKDHKVWNLPRPLP